MSPSIIAFDAFIALVLGIVGYRRGQAVFGAAMSTHRGLPQGAKHIYILLTALLLLLLFNTWLDSSIALQWALPAWLEVNYAAVVLVLLQSLPVYLLSFGRGLWPPGKSDVHLCFSCSRLLSCSSPAFPLGNSTKSRCVNLWLAASQRMESSCKVRVLPVCRHQRQISPGF